MAVVVHIGYPKTATTWLQEEYFPKVINSHFESWKIVNRHFLLSDSLQYNPKETLEKINPDGRYPNLLLSSEFLTTAISFGWHYGNYSIAIAHKIKETFPDATIVIFIRKQQSLICSAYLQYVKNGGTYSFKKWLYSGKVFSFEHLLFDKLINYYDSLFGKENVKVYLFEDFQNDPINFLTRFNVDLGLDIELNKISTKPINKALRRGVVLLHRFLNLFYKKPQGRKYFIMHIPGMTGFTRQLIKRINHYSIFGGYLSDRDLLSPNDIRAIKSFYAESNRVLNKRLNLSLKDFGYFIDE